MAILSRQRAREAQSQSTGIGPRIDEEARTPACISAPGIMTISTLGCLSRCCERKTSVGTYRGLEVLVLVFFTPHGKWAVNGGESA